ncbi:MAG: hypothetical protein PWP27_2395 [Clostridiales bacterium]|jgi:hypothetical protein|nr:hypothetical protein [Clostridiales bacterium]MDK2934585.1 hypothetical protein [Clostridiales bacterium]
MKANYILINKEKKPLDKECLNNEFIKNIEEYIIAFLGIDKFDFTAITPV